MLHPIGCITFPGIRSILPGAVCVSNFGRKECLWCWVSVSISGVCKAVFVSDCDWFAWCVGVRVCFCLSGSLQLCQRLWHVCRFRAAVLLTPWSRSPFSGRQAMPSPQSHRWKSSKPWVPFLRCRVHTWPSVSTGLQMRDQKCLAQHRPSEQSADLKQVSPSMPGKIRKKKKKKITMCSSEMANWNPLHYYFSPMKKQQLTFHSNRLMAMGSGRLLGVMLHSIVVLVHTGDDGCICTIYVIGLANTWKSQKKETDFSSVWTTVNIKSSISSANASCRCACK